ncbi:MAG: DUF4345 family protein [Gammaproteobacteria bacterium]|jgi:hypothetical protein
MEMSLRIIVVLIGLLFAFMGLNLMFNPLGGAEGMGLTPIGELGLNTLRADLGGMFLAGTVLLVLALIQRRAEWFLAVAVLMAVIAFGRVVGFVLDGNPSDATLTALGFEIVIMAVLIFAGRKLAAP